MNIYNPSNEERAFLFQEAQSLEGLMKDLGSLSVMVEQISPKVEASKDFEYRVTFVVAPETVGMRVVATNQNIYEATIAAKEETARQLNAIVNQVALAEAEGTIPLEFMH